MVFDIADAEALAGAEYGGEEFDRHLGRSATALGGLRQLSQLPQVGRLKAAEMLEQDSPSAPRRLDQRAKRGQPGASRPG